MIKILAIDDEEDYLIAINEILNELIPDCIVITALSGQEGIGKAKKELPDIILLDIKMPDMDGYEVCRLLKDDSGTKDIPIIIETGVSDFEQVLKALDLGVDAFLTKPLDADKLVSQVNVTLRIKKALDKLSYEDKLSDEEVQLKIKKISEHSSSPIASYLSQLMKLDL